MFPLQVVSQTLPQVVRNPPLLTLFLLPLLLQTLQRQILQHQTLLQVILLHLHKIPLHLKYRQRRKTLPLHKSLLHLRYPRVIPLPQTPPPRRSRRPRLPCRILPRPPSC
ncbi:hypothetical protein BCR43DRAFT_492253 [Syncephalastrum racemosum]|uniref:Uncharacterized protein n=1 Tax=Syncephalastrum racemosum TaxID=13706 RepID=A0A1X2HD86_SYNRA|nr:hypothetical protein BCR43DRAFT_492253 [Syncephalastrum racemosum]